jgi:hypothetical protein
MSKHKSNALACLGGEAAFRHSLEKFSYMHTGRKKAFCAQAASSRLDLLCILSCVKTRKYGVADNHE